MKRVIWRPAQIDNLARELRRIIPEKGLIVEVKEYKPPRTLTQSAKLHAMIGDMAMWEQTSKAEMKSFIKTLAFWPTVRVKDRYVPVSESELTREQESEIIEMLYVIAAQEYDGFEWSHEIGESHESL